MKIKILLLTVAVFTFFALNGCAIKKDFTFTVEKEFVQSNSPNKTYSLVQEFKATEISSDFDKYKDDIDNLEIVSSKYLVSYFSGSATQNVSAHVKIGESNSLQSVDLATISNVVLMQVAAKDQLLPLSSAGQQKLTDLLKTSPYSGKIYFDGQTNEVPYTATIKLKFEIKITYKRGFPYF